MEGGGRTFSSKRCFLHKCSLFIFKVCRQKCALFAERLNYRRQMHIWKVHSLGVVIPHHQILQPVRSHSDQITKLFKRSTKLMFGVQTSPRHKMTKADFLWKRLWNIFYRVCVSVRGLTFSDFMIRKSDEVFTTFAVLAFVNSRRTKNPLNNKMEKAIIMSSIKRIMIKLERREKNQSLQRKWMHLFHMSEFLFIPFLLILSRCLVEISK